MAGKNMQVKHDTIETSLVQIYINNWNNYWWHPAVTTAGSLF